MNEHDFNKIIDKAKSEHRFWFEAEENQIVSLDEIDNIERKKGVIYPTEYKHFVSRYGVGEFAFTNVYSPESEGEWSSWLQKEEYNLPDNFVPVSDNGCGDYLGFVVEAGKCSEQVYWADHEQDYSVSAAPAFDNFYMFIIKMGLNT